MRLTISTVWPRDVGDDHIKLLHIYIYIYIYNTCIIYMHVCMYACMYACMHVCMSAGR